MPLPNTLFYGLKLTEEQIVYGDSIPDKLVTFVQAGAGSGKTTIPIGVAKILGKQLHYIFPTVEEGALGYSTGDIKAKESKYLTPLHDAIIAINEVPSQAIVGEVTKFGKADNGWIHAYSHNYMRGGNLKDCIVFIDEAQNLTKKELRKILTRCHDTCNVVVAGDINQCDIDPKQSGFIPYLMHYTGKSFVQVCELTKNFRGVISSHAESLPA
jgi:phosphate starvation-inducible PhoH-like protein